MIGPTPPRIGGGDPGDAAAGDVFRSMRYRPCGGGFGKTVALAPVATNALDLDGVSLGLQAPASACSFPLRIGEDDLDALDIGVCSQAALCHAIRVTRDRCG